MIDMKFINELVYKLVDLDGNRFEQAKLMMGIIELSPEVINEILDASDEDIARLVKEKTKKKLGDL